MPWRAPFFQINIFGGSSPRWTRYHYYQLSWTKANNKRLDMCWRYEQDYFSEKGWVEPAMMWNSQTGLLSVNIRRFGVQ